MKVLTLVRHAKSSWKSASLDDRDRPLNKRGKRNAPEMGGRLARRGLRPDLLVSSPAVRALTTAQIIAKEIGYPRGEIAVEEGIYAADAERLIEIVWGFHEELTHVMLFGHNPGLTDLANALAPESIDNVPTCGVVELHFDIDEWARVGRAKARHMVFDCPKKQPR